MDTRTEEAYLPGGTKYGWHWDVPAEMVNHKYFVHLNVTQRAWPVL